MVLVLANRNSALFPSQYFFCSLQPQIALLATPPKPDRSGSGFSLERTKSGTKPSYLPMQLLSKNS
ncbi:hypothetical protein ACFOG5_08705 [Pedobacter fastidiosus]|uniref:hypothetical protein n=1 Tax=Pedobacter fastidiosus TaxID=2765361 RepID=UPI00361026FA